MRLYVVQSDLAELPVSKQKPVDGSTSNIPVPTTPRVPSKGFAEICSAASAAEAAVRVELISDASMQASG